MKKILKTGLLASSILLATMVPTHAVEPSDSSLVKLQQVMHMDSMLEDAVKIDDATMQQLIEAILKSESTDTFNPAELSEIKPLLTKYTKKMTDNIFDAAFKKQVIDTYIATAKKHYTQAEVDAMIGFYGSDIGQNIIDKQVVVTQDYMYKVMPRMIKKSQEAQSKYIPLMIDELLKKWEITE